MDALLIDRAEEVDAEALRLAALSAFSDPGRFLPAGARAGGPRGHGARARHLAWMRCDDYYKGSFEGRIVGGCIVVAHPADLLLAGLFIERPSMGCGLGSQLLRGVMARYPADSTWLLETPDYATRNHRFYERHGFRLVEKTSPEPGLGYGFRRYEWAPAVGFSPERER